MFSFFSEVPFSNVAAQSLMYQQESHFKNMLQNVTTDRMLQSVDIQFVLLQRLFSKDHLVTTTTNNATNSTNRETYSLLLFITDCTMEYNITYPPQNGIPASYREPGSYGDSSSVEACRTYCQCTYDALIFSWTNRGTCSCFRSDTGRFERFIYGHGGDISGAARGCGGTCEWLK